MEKNARLRLLLVMELLFENTDKAHGVSMNDILNWLEENGLAGERKSIYEDIHALQRYGLDISYSKEEKKYHIQSRVFSNADIKSLIKAVHSADFIDKEEGDRLVGQLLAFLSSYDREQIM